MPSVRSTVLALVMVVLTGGIAAYAVVGRGGFAADRPPGRIETAVARRLVWLSIPSAERNATNPAAPEKANAREASEHFDDHCAVCHGSDGRGRSEIGPRMYPPVPALTSPAIQQLSDGALFSIIQNGVRWTGMPAFRATHSAEQTWALVALIRNMPTIAASHGDAHDAAAHDHAPATTIAMDGTAFVPADVTVRAGETIAWVNTDPFPHNIDSRSGDFHSGDLDPDASWRFRPITPGTYEYVCTLHPGMKGVLHVTAPR